MRRAPGNHAWLRHPPGAEAEVDFGKTSFVIAGVLTRLSIFHLRLSHSAEAVHMASPSKGHETFLEGQTIAFEHPGGCPHRIRYDNLKRAVARILKGPRPGRDRAFVAARSHHGFDSFFCEPGRGGQPREGRRGRRGRPLPAAATSCWCPVASLAKVNALLAAADAADEARHVAGRSLTVGAMAAAEQPHLRPPPGESFPAGAAGRSRGGPGTRC